MSSVLSYIVSTPAAPRRHPIPRDHATEPSPTHAAALAIPGERTGVAAKLDERRYFIIALPETLSNHYIFFLLIGRALDSGQAERHFKSPCLCFFLLYFLLYGCTTVLHTWIRGLLVDGFFCLTELCCIIIVHTWWVMGGLFWGGWYFYCRTAVSSCCCTW